MSVAQHREAKDPYRAFDELAGGRFRDDDSIARSLFDCCEPLIRGIVRGICVCRRSWRYYDLEGITQDCLAEVWKSRKQYRGCHPGQLWAFIKTISFRTSVGRNPRPISALSIDDEKCENLRPVHDDQLPVQMDEYEQLRHCLDCLRQSEPDWYSAILLCDLLRWPENESARALGIAKNTLGDRKRKGRTWLRQCLEQKSVTSP